MKPHRVALYSLLMGSAAVAHAAQPVGSVVRSEGTTNLTFNVSFFDVGLSTSATGASGTGAGAGKVTLQPFVTHSALSSFPALFDAAARGTHFSSCTLTTQGSSGEAVEIQLIHVALEGVDAIASSASGEDRPRYAFVKAQFEYQQIKVHTSGGADDGGSSPGPVQGGWNITQNKAS